MLAKGDKRFLYCVQYLDKQSWKCEYFTDHVEASNFRFALLRSPDLIKAVELYVIGCTINSVSQVFRCEV